MKNDKALRDHLVYLLNKSGSHSDLKSAIKSVPFKVQGKRPKGAPHSPWEELEHIRIAQWDILQFMRNPKHVSPKWPDEYWPATPAPPNEKAWNRSATAILKDLRAITRLVEDNSINLFAKIPHGDGQTILREIMLVADHNAYHLGQLVLTRRLLGAWKES